MTCQKQWNGSQHKGFVLRLAESERVLQDTMFALYIRRGMKNFPLQWRRTGGIGAGAWRSKKPGKLIISHRYNHLPLLPSRPGGFSRSCRMRLTRRCKTMNFYHKCKRKIPAYLRSLKNHIFVSLNANPALMEKKSSLLQFTMTYGLILGIALIIFTLILYMLDILPSNMKRILLTGLVNIVLMWFWWSWFKSLPW